MLELPSKASKVSTHLLASVSGHAPALRTSVKVDWYTLVALAPCTEMGTSQLRSAPLAQACIVKRITPSMGASTRSLMT